ncbi:MAG: hypothetical protein GC150_00725 [Rhizobiales bacterium]|nr:hypothetical protein [Hyphomicrobiales bacterium]
MPRTLRVSDLAVAMLVGQATDLPAKGIEMVPPAPPAHVIMAPAPRLVLRHVIERLIAERNVAIVAPPLPVRSDPTWSGCCADTLE